ncbi:MAG: COG1361 S-layer family protein [archaeon]
MSFKKSLILLGILLFGLSGSFATGNIDISTEDITPSSIEPGDDVTVQVRVENPTNPNVDEPEVQIDSVEPDVGENFKIQYTSGVESLEDSELCAGCSRTLTFFLQAESNISSGVYPAEIEVNHDNTRSSTEQIMIDVRGEPDIDQEYEIIEDDIYPGKDFNIIGNVTNKGTGKAKNLRITPENDEIGMELGNNIYIGELEPGETTSFEETFTSNENIDTGYTQLILSNTYKDTRNNEYKDNERMGIDFKDKSKIVVQNLRVPSQIQEGKEFSMKLRLENIGDGEAKNVVASIDGPFSGLTRGYFGRMEKDEDLLYIFDLIPYQSGEIPVTLNIEYEDDYGTHDIQEKVNINVENNNTNIYILTGLVISIIVILYLVFRTKKNRS